MAKDFETMEDSNRSGNATSTVCPKRRGSAGCKAGWAHGSVACWRPG
jgi:hypothetical protein